MCIIFIYATYLLPAGKKSHVEKNRMSEFLLAKIAQTTQTSPPHTLKDTPKPHSHPRTTTTAHDLNGMDYCLSIEPLVDLGCSILA